MRHAWQKAICAGEATPGAAARPSKVKANRSVGVKGKYRVNRKILIIVENLTVPLDRRVWTEARALRDAGYTVSIICPKMGL